jgi:hypothetical protein
MNLGTLRDQCAKFTGDPDLTRHSAADYLTALNRAQEQFALDTRALWKDKTWTSVSGTATYDLPTDFMFEDSAMFDGKGIDPISRRDFAVLSPGVDWTLEIGTPTRYLIDPEEAQKKILLYPIPTANDASKTISMRYFPLPTALAADTDTPLNSSALMAQFHIGLAAYAAWLLLLTEEMTPAILQKRRELLTIYADASTKATDLFKNTVSAPWRMRGSRPV